MCANTTAGDITDINVGAIWFIAAVSERSAIDADAKASYVFVDSKVVFTDA